MWEDVIKWRVAYERKIFCFYWGCYTAFHQAEERENKSEGDLNMSKLLHTSIILGRLYIQKLPSGAEFILNREDALSYMALGWSGIRVATVGDEYFIQEKMNWIEYLDEGQGC